MTMEEKLTRLGEMMRENGKKAMEISTILVGIEDLVAKATMIIESGNIDLEELSKIDSDINSLYSALELLTGLNLLEDME